MISMPETKTSRVILYTYTFTLFILFNILLVVLSKPFVLGDYSNLFYFFSYRIEFMKRGLPGTILDMLNIPVTSKVITALFVVGANLLFILMFYFFKLHLLPKHKKLFYILFTLFVISPFSAQNWGYDFARSDVYLLVIELVIGIIILKKAKGVYFAIPILLILALLIHESFLFICAPLLLAIMLVQYKQRVFPRRLIMISMFAIAASMVIITLFGRVSVQGLNDIYIKAYNEPLPPHLPLEHPTMIVTTSLKTNLHYTFTEYLRPSVWKDFLAVAPFLFASVFLYFKLAYSRNYSLVEKLIFFSPFCAFPMLILAVDFYRYIGMSFINFFISGILLYSNNSTRTIKVNLHLKLAILTILTYCFFGALGVRDTLPYLKQSVGYRAASFIKNRLLLN